MTERKSYRRSPKMVPKTVLIFGLVLLLAAGVLAIRSTETVMKATSQQKEPFTEVYFAHPEQLPAKVQGGQEYELRFVLANAEHRSMLYPYRIMFTDENGDDATLAEGSALVEAGQRQTVPQTITVPPGTGRGKITVNITSKGQAIHFWLERSL